MVLFPFIDLINLCLALSSLFNFPFSLDLSIVVTAIGPFDEKIPVKYESKLPGVLFRFGIYNGKRSRPLTPQVVYYDSFKRGKTCEKTSLWHDCSNLK